MLFLDLDLDFFLDAVANRRDDSGDRLPSLDYKPWEGAAVRLFLEECCGLSPKRRTPGTIVEHHDQAWDLWRNLASEGTISVPFDVVHIDAHADLGLGDSGYVYLMSDLLHVAPHNRPSRVDRSQIKPGNYLAFAVACRWIRTLHYVKHPKTKDDLLIYHFKDYDPKTGFIQLKKLPPGFNKTTYIKDVPQLALEPEVPFEISEGTSFRTRKLFDFVILSRSPGFTPQESDDLIPVIGEYITGNIL